MVVRPVLGCVSLRNLGRLGRGFRLLSRLGKRWGGGCLLWWFLPCVFVDWFVSLWVSWGGGVGVWLVFDTPVVVLCLLGFGGVWLGVGLRGWGLWCRFFFCCRSRPAGVPGSGLWVCGGGLRTQ